MAERRLEGKVAIITGAAGGIGEASARLFAAHGAIVVIADIKDELGARVASSIGPDKCCYKHCDLRDERQVEQVVNYAVETYGRVDIMFCNAGIGDRYLNSNMLDLSLEDLDNVMAVNFRGAAAAGMKHAARAMVERGTRGAILCTGSPVTVMGGFGPPAYTVSKCAITGLVVAAASELGKHGIRVNCLSPGGVATPLTCGGLGLEPSQVEQMFQGLMAPLKGVPLRARNIAEAALYLVSDESAFVTGQNLMVDGGITAVGRIPSVEHQPMPVDYGMIRRNKSQVELSTWL